MDPTYPLVPITSFFACFLAIISVSPSMLRSWNIGICSFALWVYIQCFNFFVRTIVWKDNANILIPVWCDIVTHIDIGSSVGLPACCFVITRRLFMITRLRDASKAGASRRSIAFDLFLCIGFPCITMGLYYIVQGSRFQVVEELGCVNAEDISDVSILLIDSWPIVFPAISTLFYCPRIVWAFHRRRKEMNEFLDSSVSVDRSSYYRMLALGCLDALVTLPISILNLVVDAGGTRIAFYQGWTLLHTQWAPLPVPKSDWSTLGFWFFFIVEWAKWINIFWGLLFFLLFGTTIEARARYWRVFWVSVKPLGFMPSATPEKSDVVFGSVAVDPTWIGELISEDQNAHMESNMGTVFEYVPRSEDGTHNFGSTTSISAHSLEEGEAGNRLGITEDRGNLCEKFSTWAVWPIPSPPGVGSPC